ncbi:MAG TPA: trigger factor [Candidatus Absconditabacterales bacterium]|nr:trigger factor [Candidatus Absconditabacterales bacterium]HPK28047.1 trigger factor [Candidatus Absconditabacterales bacterium]
MEKKLIKLEDSNYEIQVIFTDEEKENAKNEAIKILGKDLKISGFRDGHAPINLIEEKLNPEHVKMGTYEYLINKGLHEVLDENQEIKFIGEPYEPKEYDKENRVGIKLDIYPEVQILNDKRKSLKMGKMETKATDKEIEDSLLQLKKNYAEYKDTNKIEKDTVSKVSLDFLDKDGKSLEIGTVYVGEPEFTESKFYDIFIGKEKNMNFELDYKENDLPPTFHKRKSEQTPAKINVIIKDIKQIILPEFTEENIKKFFPDQKEVENLQQLKEYIKNEIEKQKHDSELIKNIEEYINNIRDKSMKITIPQTLIRQEFKSRIDNLEQRFGGQEKLTEYFKQLGDEKTKQFVEDISKASQDSLEKFFILQKITEELKIDIDRQKAGKLEVEQKLYDKVSK